MTGDNNEKPAQLTAADTFEHKPLSLYLLWSVFITGAGVMAAEMAAPRLLAPSFGASQLIWTNIIGTILTALTLGAFAGGKLADRWPSERSYALVLVISGASLAAVPLISRPFLTWASSALFEMKIGLFLISLFSVSVFFAPPVFLLGMLGPWAIKIAGSARSDLGSVAGVIAAFSAAGSIAGTFLTSLVFLPVFGTRATILFTAALIASTGAWKRPSSACAPSANDHARPCHRRVRVHRHQSYGGVHPAGHTPAQSGLGATPGPGAAAMVATGGPDGWPGDRGRVHGIPAHPCGALGRPYRYR